MRIGMWMAALAMALWAGAAAAANVGFQRIEIPVAGDKPTQAGVWYPTAAPEVSAPISLGRQSVATNAPVLGSGLALVAMSHGTGGSFADDPQTAHALAQAGFVVIAISHTGDTYDDRSRSMRIAERPAQLERAIDYMLGEWRDRAALDPRRIGAYGFSSGGFTVLAAIGGEPDLSKIGPHCVEHPHFYDCQLNRTAPGAAPPPALAHPAPVAHDPRIRAAVVAAPALGFTFVPSGLANVHVPIQLWRGEWDTVLPQPYYAEAVFQALPLKPDYRVLRHADHFDFLPACSEALAKAAPPICASAIDRAATHARFDAEVVKFFRAKLR